MIMRGEKPAVGVEEEEGEHIGKPVTYHRAIPIRRGGRRRPPKPPTPSLHIRPDHTQWQTLDIGDTGEHRLNPTEHSKRKNY